MRPSLTAPVLTNQDWHAIPRRGVATVDHTYRPNENGLSSYHSNEQVYSKALPTEPLPSYAVNQGLSMIRLQHEAVKQSIEGPAYPRELLADSAAAAAAAYVSTPRYSQREWLPAPIEGQGSHPSPYTQLTPDHYSMAQTTDELQVLSGMERIEISGPPSTFSSSGSSSYPGDSYPQTANAPAVSSNASGPPTTTTTTTTGTVEEEEGSATNADKMQAEIERLREQLRKKEETIQQQNVQLHYSNTGTTAAKPIPVKLESVPPPPTPQYSTPPQGNPQFPTPPQGNTQFPGPPQGNMQFPGPPQGNTQFPTPPQGNVQFPGPPQGNTQFPGPPQGNVQFPTPPQGNVQFPTPPQGNVQFSTHLQRNTQFSTPVQGNGQYSGTIQQMFSNGGVLVGEDASQPMIHSHGYTAKQLQAAAMAAALVGSQSSAAPYYPPATPPAVAAAPSYPVHWSGPHNTVQTTPPSTGYITLPHQVVLPSSTPPQHPMMVRS